MDFASNARCAFALLAKGVVGQFALVCLLVGEVHYIVVQLAELAALAAQKTD